MDSSFIPNAHISTTAPSEDMQTAFNRCNQLIEQHDLAGILAFISQHQHLPAHTRDQLLDRLRVHWLEQQDPNQIANYANLSYFEQSRARRRLASISHALSVCLFGFGLLSQVPKAWQSHLQTALDYAYKNHLPEQSLSLFPSYFESLLALKPRILNACISWHQPYLLLRILEQHGLIDYHADLFDRAFAQTVVFHREDHPAYPQTTEWQNIFKHYTTDPIIYERELPKLFDSPTNIHLSTVKLEHEYFNPWHKIISTLLEQKKLAQDDVIASVLQIQSREWDKKLQDFFLHILKDIHISPDAYLAHQPVLFNLLHHPENAKVKLALELIKPLLNLAEFQFLEYLGYLNDVMCRANFKTSIQFLIKQLSQSLQAQPQYLQQILSTISHGLMQQDSKIQLNIAKILIQHLKTQPKTLKSLVLPLQSDLLADAKNLLSDYLEPYSITETQTTLLERNTALESNTILESDPELTPINVFISDQEIHLAQSWQDLLFLMAQPVAADQIYQIDVVLSSWLILQAEFPTDYKKQLKPVIKTLSKVGNVSPLNLIHRLWVDFLQNPTVLSTDLSYTAQFPYLRNHIALTRYILFWFHHFAQMAQQKIRLPLLSLPSHQPSYIKPERLVERILAYEAQHLTLNPWDFALAIARMPRQSTVNTLVTLDQIQCEQTRQILAYCLGQIPLKDALNHQTEWQKIQPTTTQQWFALWQTALDTHATIDQPQQNQLRSFDEVLSHFSYSTRANANHATLQSGVAHLYSYVKSYNYNDGSDLSLCLTRHFTPIDPFLSDYSYCLDHCLSDDQLHSNPLAMFQRFSAADYPINPATLLIFACESFNPTKIVRLGLSDHLAQSLIQHQINLKQLAYFYRELIARDYAPMNRLIECLQQIKGISTVSDLKLATLLAEILSLHPIPERLPKQFAKFFELYYELIQQYQFLLSDDLKQSLALWQKFKPLQPIIKKMRM